MTATSTPLPQPQAPVSENATERENVESAWRRAARLFFRLLQEGSLSRLRDAALCRDLEDEEVRAAVRVLEEEAEVQVLSTADAVYVFPALGSQLFGYTNQELRQRLRVPTNDHLALSCFSILALLSLFYRGQGFDAKSRDFVTIEDWQRFLTEKLQGTRDAGDEPPEADPLRLNMPGILAAWEELIPYDETKVRPSKAANSQVSLLAKVLLFLQEEDLVRVEEERIIYPTPRLDAGMANSLTGEPRRAELAAFLSGAGTPCVPGGGSACR
jgi:hypothetical protein